MSNLVKWYMPKYIVIDISKIHILALEYMCYLEYICDLDILVHAFSMAGPAAHSRKLCQGYQRSPTNGPIWVSVLGSSAAKKGKQPVVGKEVRLTQKIHYLENIDCLGFEEANLLKEVF